MAAPIHLELLADFFNRIGHSCHFECAPATFTNASDLGTYRCLSRNAARAEGREVRKSLQVLKSVYLRGGRFARICERIASSIRDTAFAFSLACASAVLARISI
jgi:hypothetical protein